MKKKFYDILYYLDNEKAVFIDLIVEYTEDRVYVTDIIAGEDIEYRNYSFLKGDYINNMGDESMIRSEDINIDELNYTEIIGL